jgi:hypothetical protein
MRVLEVFLDLGDFKLPLQRRSEPRPSRIKQQVVVIRHSEDRASWYILIIKTKELHYFSNLFW